MTRPAAVSTSPSSYTSSAVSLYCTDLLTSATIGPILASKLGMRTVDLGLPQLSMHSIREMAAVDDLVHGLDLLQAVYRTFARVDATLVVDKNL